MGKLIYMIAIFFVMVFFILMTSIFSIFGLHAKTNAKFFVPPNKDIYECTLQHFDENHLEQFQLGKDQIITCYYKCVDTHGAFKWVEKIKDKRGCKFNTRVYKTEAAVWKWIK